MASKSTKLLMRLYFIEGETNQRDGTDTRRVRAQVRDKLKKARAFNVRDVDDSIHLLPDEPLGGR